MLLSNFFSRSRISFLYHKRFVFQLLLSVENRFLKKSYVIRSWCFVQLHFVSFQQLDSLIYVVISDSEPRRSHLKCTFQWEDCKHNRKIILSQTSLCFFLFLYWALDVGILNPPVLYSSDNRKIRKIKKRCRK
jgi:hypothetical protein